MTTFEYHADILTRYPDIAGGIIVPTGMHNGPTPQRLHDAYMAEQKAVLAQIGDPPLGESAAQPDTTDAIITVEAQHPGGQAQIEAAVKDLLSLLSIYAGGSFKSALLGRDQPAI